jgi:hypothetical protein
VSPDHLVRVIASVAAFGLAAAAMRAGLGLAVEVLAGVVTYALVWTALRVGFRL